MDQEVEDLLENEVNKIYGRCRCCLDYGYVKDIWTEYLWEGAHEIYGEMLMETFSIAWESIPNEKEQICDMCVSRLRDANMFKREVLASEQLLREEAETDSESVKAERLSDLDQYENTTEDVIEDPEMKEEVEYEEVQYEEEFVADEVEYEEVEFLEEEIVTETAPEANVFDTPTGESSKQKSVSAHKPKRKRIPGLNTRNYKNYSEDTLRKSIEFALNSDRSISEVAAMYGVPRKTLTARVYNAKHQPKPDEPGNSPDRTLRHTKRPYSKAIEVNMYEDDDETAQTWPDPTQEDPGEKPKIHSKETEVNKYEHETNQTWSDATLHDPDEKPAQNRRKSQRKIHSKATEVNKYEDEDETNQTWPDATQEEPEEKLARNRRKSQRKSHSKAMEVNMYEDDDETTQTWPDATQENLDEKSSRSKSLRKIHSKAMEVINYEDEDENSLTLPDATQEDPDEIPARNTRKSQRKIHSKVTKVNKYKDEDETTQTWPDATQEDTDEKPAPNRRKSQTKIRSKAIEVNEYEDETIQTWPDATQEDLDEKSSRNKKKSRKEIHSKAIEVNEYEDDDESMTWPDATQLNLDEKSSRNKKKSQKDIHSKAMEVINYEDEDENSLTWPDATQQDPARNKQKIQKEIQKHRHNVKAILTWSTATPFHTRDSLYICFYCGENYSSPGDLKNHTLLHEDKSKAYNIRNASTFSLKVDITDLKCLVCLESIKSLEYLFVHLRSHGEVIHRDIKNHIIPYKFDTNELKCAICGERFKFLIHLRDHMRNEHYRNYECKQCGNAFINRSLLTEHKKVCSMREGAKESDNAMTRIGEVFKHKDNVETILTWSNATPFKTRGTGYTCFFCEEYYPSTSDVRNHTQLSHTDKSKAHNITNVASFSLKLDITGLKCLICEETIDSFDNLMTHLKNHGKIIHMDIKNQIMPFKFDTDEFKCVLCERVFPFFKTLSEHMSEHYRNYKCDECNKTCINKNSLKAHRGIHKTGKFKCSFCPKVLLTKVRRYLHQRVFHGLANKAHKCWKCNMYFQDPIKRAKHDVEFHGAKPRTFACDACGKTFPTQRAVRVHKTSYHLMYQTKNWECSECSMAFSQKSRLDRHMVKHTRVKDIECTFCDKTFGHKDYLRLHMKVHDENDKLRCKVCSKMFCYKHVLRNHMKISHNLYE